jgi:hypothetical protein
MSSPKTGEYIIGGDQSLCRRRVVNVSRANPTVLRYSGFRPGINDFAQRRQAIGKSVTNSFPVDIRRRVMRRSYDASSRRVSPYPASVPVADHPSESAYARLRTVQESFNGANHLHSLAKPARLAPRCPKRPDSRPHHRQHTDAQPELGFTSMRALASDYFRNRAISHTIRKKTLQAWFTLFRYRASHSRHSKFLASSGSPWPL